MKRNLWVFWALAAVLIVSIGIQAQTTTKIKGVVFADYNYNVGNHSESAQGLNDFSFRRIYFTFENSLAKNIKMRFRLESAHPKFGTSEKITPFVKHAYLEWKNIIPNHTLYLGIAETNAFKNAENYWDYRSIEKTIMDLNKISSSADMGIALKGSLIDEKVHHWLTIYNGTGYGSAEVDKYKKIGYSFWVTPVEGLILEAYADYEKQDAATATFKYAKDYYQGSSYMTVKAFAGYSGKAFSLGAEWFQRSNRQSGADDAAGVNRADVRKVGFSLFGSWITPLPKLKVFARYDSFDPNTDDDIWSSDSQNGIDDNYSLIIAGLDFIPRGNIHFMPNIMIRKFAAAGMESDITARLTLYYKFSTGKIVI
ncbi:hypothetical protein KAR48_03635 [bacterium]|nr:hypothetical protein [bacterium]